jgi:hypothetical protein
MRASKGIAGDQTRNRFHSQKTGLELGRLRHPWYNCIAFSISRDSWLGFLALISRAASAGLRQLKGRWSARPPRRGSETVRARTVFRQRRHHPITRRSARFWCWATAGGSCCGRCQDRLNRAGQPLGERLHRELQRSPARRLAIDRNVVRGLSVIYTCSLELRAAELEVRQVSFAPDHDQTDEANETGILREYSCPARHAEAQLLTIEIWRNR